MDFISDLSNEQYQNLLSGKAVVRYEQLEPNQRTALLVEKFRSDIRLLKLEDIKKQFKKEELLLISEHYNVSNKSRDTKQDIINKLVHSFGENIKSTANNDHMHQKLAEEIHKFDSVEKGKDYLANHPKLRTKKDIIALAKSMDVYVSQTYTKQKLLNRIAESIIGAKLRGQIIRSEK